MAEKAVTIRLIGDAEQLSSVFKKTEQEASGWGDKLTSAGQKLTLGVTAPILAAGAATFKMAANAEDAMSAVVDVFGKSADSIEKWAASASESFGMSANEARQSATQFGIMGRAAGLTGKDMQDFATETTELAADLKSFYGGTVAEAQVAISSLFRGETEPIRRYGVAIDAAAVKAEAARMGLLKLTVDSTKVKDAQLGVEAALKKVTEATQKHGKGSLEARQAQVDLEKAQQAVTKSMEGQAGELDQNAKLLATQSLLMKQTEITHGNFAKTADGASNSMETTKAKFKDVATELGMRLLPLGTKLVNLVSSWLGAFKAIPEPMQTVVLAVLGVAAAVGPLLLVVGKMIAVAHSLAGAFKVVQGAFWALTKVLMFNPWLLLIAGIVALVVVVVKNWDTITRVIGDAWDWIVEKTKANWDTIKDVLAVAGRIILALVTGGLSEVVLAVVRHWDAITGATSAAWSWVKDHIGAIMRVVLAVLTGGLSEAVLWVVRHWDQIKAATAAAWNAVWGTVVNVFEGIKGAVGAGVGWVRDTLGRAVDWFVGTWTRGFHAMRDAAAGAWEGIKDAAKAAVNFVIGLINVYIRGINRLGDLAGKIPGVPAFRIPEVPRLARGGTAREGGLVTVGEAGPETLFLPRGASVVPLTGADLAHAAGGRPTVVHEEHYHIGTLVTHRQLKDELYDMLLRDKRAGGSRGLG